MNKLFSLLVVGIFNVNFVISLITPQDRSKILKPTPSFLFVYFFNYMSCFLQSGRARLAWMWSSSLRQQCRSVTSGSDIVSVLSFRISLGIDVGTSRTCLSRDGRLENSHVLQTDYYFNMYVFCYKLV